MPGELLGFGIEGLDGILGGGLQKGSVTNITGPPGSGKTHISLAFLSEGLRHDENGVLVSFSTVPIVPLLRELRGRSRYAPIFETDEPVVMDLSDLDKVDIIISIIDDGGLDRLVLDHPESMSLRESGRWFPLLEDLLSSARLNGVTTLLVDYDGGTPSGVGRYVSEGIINVSRRERRINAGIIKWDHDTSLIGREVQEGVPGDWTD